MWEEYAMSGVDESSDSHTMTVTARSGWQLGTEEEEEEEERLFGKINVHYA